MYQQKRAKKLCEDGKSSGKDKGYGRGVFREKACQDGEQIGKTRIVGKIVDQGICREGGRIAAHLKDLGVVLQIRVDAAAHGAQKQYSLNSGIGEKSAGEGDKKIRACEMPFCCKQASQGSVLPQKVCQRSKNRLLQNRRAGSFLHGKAFLGKRETVLDLKKTGRYPAIGDRNLRPVRLGSS